MIHLGGGARLLTLWVQSSDFYKPMRNVSAEAETQTLKPQIVVDANKCLLGLDMLETKEIKCRYDLLENFAQQG